MPFEAHSTVNRSTHSVCGDGALNWNRVDVWRDVGNADRIVDVDDEYCYIFEITSIFQTEILFFIYLIQIENENNAVEGRIIVCDCYVMNGKYLKCEMKKVEKEDFVIRWSKVRETTNSNMKKMVVECIISNWKKRRRMDCKANFVLYKHKNKRWFLLFANLKLEIVQYMKIW